MSFSRMKFIPVCLILSLGLKAHALGVVNGGGGNEVVCFDSTQIAKTILDPAGPNFQQITDDQLSHITSIEALDLYMAKMPKGLQAAAPVLISEVQTETERQFVQRTSDRFLMYFPWLSNLISLGGSYFPDENIMMSTGGISRITDENNSVYLGNPKCVVATVAFQHDSAHRNGYLEIDDRLYHHPKQTQFSRNVLYLHEVIYSQTRTVYNAKDSLTTRTLIGQVLKQQLTIGSILKTWNEIGALKQNSWGPSFDFITVSNGLSSFLGLIQVSYRVITENPQSDWNAVIRTYCPLPPYNQGLGCPDKMKQATLDVLKSMKWNETTQKFEVPLTVFGDLSARMFTRLPDLWGPALLQMPIPTN